MTSLAISTGLPRSGTNLFTKAMSAHAEISWACGPNIEIFREFRNAVALQLPDDGSQKATPKQSAFSDYFADAADLRLLQSVLGADLNLKFSMSDLPALRARAASRPGHDSPDIAAHMAELTGGSFSELIHNLAAIIAQVRSKQNLRLVGIHESWIIEAIPAFLRTFSQARAVVFFRDPRATIASMLANARKDPSAEAPILGYVRHFRKQYAISAWMQLQEELNSRVLVLRHEDLLSQPESVLRMTCDFLGVTFCEVMLNTELYWDYGTSNYWRGNSAHSDLVLGFDPNRNAHWRDELRRETAVVVDALCTHELRALGYETAESSAVSFEDFRRGLEKQDGAGNLRWSGVDRSWSQEYELEVERAASVDSIITKSTMRSSFDELLLATEVYDSNFQFRVGT